MGGFESGELKMGLDVLTSWGPHSVDAGALRWEELEDEVLTEVYCVVEILSFLTGVIIMCYARRD